MSRWSLFVILLGHFTAAFAALGMPPFFALILRDSLHSDATQLAGWLYAVPILCTALSAPWWGRLADRVGTRAMLVRAQLGLAVSFLLAGFAGNTTQFFLALLLQGLLGGTFGASNAYLASALSGRALARSLTMMQGSARAALVGAPVVLGLLVEWVSPIVLYRYLALLPLLSAVLILCLPPLRVTQVEGAGEATTPPRRDGAPPLLTAGRIYLFQFGFAFATVITFPYFIPFVQQERFGMTAGAAGLLFALPHLVYLVCSAPLGRWIGEQVLAPALAAALLLLGVSLLGQMQAAGLQGLIGFRLLMGLAMTLTFVALHGAIAAVIAASSAGRTMGRIESSAKWGGVSGAIAAGLATKIGGMAAPFALGAVCVLLSVGYLGALSLSRRRLVTTRIGEE